MNGQNLVNNPSFEILSSCGYQATLAVSWVSPTQAGTSDLYNSCTPNRIPSNGNYYQWPKTGNSFTGIFSIEPTYPVREYLHSHLISPLIGNNIYYIKFYAVLSNFSKDASNNLAMYLSSNSIYQSGATNFLLNYTPQIQKFNNPIIADTLNWVEISGVYQANGTENYITIGNFNNNATTITKVVDSSKTYGAYYFIEDVSVENITTTQWQYRDTTIYLGDSVLIGPAITGLNVDWFDMSSTFIKNAPGIYVKPIITTPYQATETFNSVVYNHTVTVTVLLPTKVNDFNKLKNNLRLFPNPSTGILTIDISTLRPDDWSDEALNVTNNSEQLGIKITDLLGKEVFNETYKEEINISNLENGIYFLSLYKGRELVETKKVVKQ